MPEFLEFGQPTPEKPGQKSKYLRFLVLTGQAVLSLPAEGLERSTRAFLDYSFYPFPARPTLCAFVWKLPRGKEVLVWYLPIRRP